MPELTQDVALTWIERWERQQEESLPDREERFTALIDAVELGTGRPDPVVVDLGCGPGSLSVRLLDRLRKGAVVGVAGGPVLPGPADGVVSTTALHWLTEPDLRRLYATLATVLRPGGLFLDGDHFGSDKASAPTLDRLEHGLLEREDQRRFPNGHGEGWTRWWEAAAADPALSGLGADGPHPAVAPSHHGSPSGLLATHVDALRA